MARPVTVMRAPPLHYSSPSSFGQNIRELRASNKADPQSNKADPLSTEADAASDGDTSRLFGDGNSARLVRIQSLDIFVVCDVQRGAFDRAILG